MTTDEFLTLLTKVTDHHDQVYPDSIFGIWLWGEGYQNRHDEDWTTKFKAAAERYCRKWGI